jgi:hypothetical protein
MQLELSNEFNWVGASLCFICMEKMIQFPMHCELLRILDHGQNLETQ